MSFSLSAAKKGRIRPLIFFPLVFLLLHGEIFSPVVFSLISVVHGKEKSSPYTPNSPWKDFEQSLQYLYKGGLHQFQTSLTPIYLGAGLPVLALALTQDKSIIQRQARSGGSRNKNFWQSMEVLAIASTFPILPLTFYTVARMNQDSKLLQFSIEFFSTMYLALIESALLSFVPVHDRPDKTNLNKWETNFRGPSSFPSGHVIPLAALTFKTYEFYGPMPAIVPASITALISIERVRSKKHYLSDVLGGIFFAGLASQGIRSLAQSTPSQETNSKTWHWLPYPYPFYGLQVSLLY